TTPERNYGFAYRSSPWTRVYSSEIAAASVRRVVTPRWNVLACHYDENDRSTASDGSCGDSGREGGPQRHLPHQNRSFRSFESNGSRLLPDRRIWPETDRIAWPQSR